MRPCADTNHQFAAGRLALLLARSGDLSGLQARADDGDMAARMQLADLLARRDDLDGLYARVNAGDWEAGTRLVELLVRKGGREEAERLRRFSVNPDGSIASA